MILTCTYRFDPMTYAHDEFSLLSHVVDKLHGDHITGVGIRKLFSGSVQGTPKPVSLGAKKIIMFIRSLSLILNKSLCTSPNMKRVKYSVKYSSIKHTQQIYANCKFSFSLNFICVINLLDITYGIIMNKIIH